MPAANKQNRRKGARRPRRQNQGDPSNDVGVPRAIRPYTLTRSFNLGNISPVVSDAGYLFAAQASQLPSNTEFYNMFQEYRLVWASYEITFLPASTERYTPVVWYGNFLGGDTPSSLDDVMQLSGQRKFAFGPDRRTLRLGFKPKLRTSDTVQQMRPSPWINIGSLTASHYGLYAWFQFYNTTYSLGASLSITATYTVSLRGTR